MSLLLVGGGVSVKHPEAVFDCNGENVPGLLRSQKDTGF